MLLTDLLTDYLEYARVEANFTPATLRTWGAWLRRFSRWIGPNATEADFTTPTLKRFLYHLRPAAKPLRPRTVRSAFCALRNFGAWMLAQGVLSAPNPAAAVDLPKLDDARRELVTDEEVSALLEACDRLRNESRAALARAVFSIMAYCALRRAELMDLHLDDVSIIGAHPVLIVRAGKGRKARTIALHADCALAIKEWLPHRPPDCQHPYLFAHDRQRRLAERGLKTLIEEVTAIAGFKGATNIKQHSIRHNAATWMLENGATMKDVQMVLGHANQIQTEHYVHSSGQRLRSIAKKLPSRAHPPAEPPPTQPQRLPSRIGREPGPTLVRRAAQRFRRS